jgi:DNA-nicking Smr family endonuclease
MNTIERLEANIRRGCERAQAPFRKGPIGPVPSSAPTGLDYLHRLLVTHTPLELLCWSFHPLPVSLIEACSEGVRAETAGAGFEEEDVLLLLCQALHSQCVEQEWGVLEAGSEVAATALPHLAFRSDGQARCEAEVLHILCGDLRAAVQAAASSVLLEQARAEVEEGAAACAALPSGRQPRHSSGHASTLAAAAGGRAGGGAWRHSGAAPSRTATSSTDFPSLAALPYLEPAGESKGVSQLTAGHLSAAAASAAAAAAAASSSIPSAQASGAPLLPQAAALLSQLACTCSAGLASSQAPHSSACRNGLYSQLSQRTSALAARRAELLRTAAATHRDMAKRFAGAAAGVYAERAREVGAEMRATQELASHVMLMANNPGLCARGSSGCGRRAGTLNLGQALGLAVSAGSAAQAEVDLHGQHLREAVALLQDTILPQARAGQVRVLRVITGVGNHSQGGGVLREGVGHFLRGCVGEEGGLGVLRCVAEGSGAFLVHLKA